MLVARLESPREPFLQEMGKVLQTNPDVPAVALPSPGPCRTLPRHCHKLEVRGALIDLKRLFRLLPLPLSGTSDDGGSHFEDGGFGWSGSLADLKVDTRRDDHVHDGVDIDHPHDVADILLRHRPQQYEM